MKGSRAERLTQVELGAWEEIPGGEVHAGFWGCEEEGEDLVQLSSQSLDLQGPCWPDCSVIIFKLFFDFLSQKQTQSSSWRGFYWGFGCYSEWRKAGCWRMAWGTRVLILWLMRRLMTGVVIARVPGGGKPYPRENTQSHGTHNQKGEGGDTRSHVRSCDTHNYILT